MTITPEDLVRREVHYCVSALVSNLASAYGNWDRSALGAQTRELGDMCEQAFELACPIDDWEEAATQAGWSRSAGVFTGAITYRHKDAPLGEVHIFDGWQDLCESESIDPYQWEVYEHWIVSDWLAELLEANGEKVDRDFAGLTVWARTTTGQSIATDAVIERITAALNAA